MAIDAQTFETLVPSRYISFTFPNPVFSIPLLRVAVLDSPIPLDSPARVAAMLVPPRLDSDWIFITESGHLQLLLNSPGISRLILIGNHHIPNNTKSFEENLIPLLIALSPKSYVENGLIDIPFLIYEDNVISSVVLEKCVGENVGEILVEDVQIECSSGQEFRRRLRFKRMPNLVQTEIRILASKNRERDGFCMDLGSLVHPYLGPMVASLALIGGCIEDKVKGGFMPGALCLGIGGGALPSFLKKQLRFDVLAVELDNDVLKVARKYFGLEESEHLRVCVGDGIEKLEKLARASLGGGHLDHFSEHEVDNICCLRNKDKFDVVMVDLDASDVRHGVMAPPLEFVKKSVLMNIKMVLCGCGIVVVNVIPHNRSFYDMLIHEFGQVFHELFEIDVGNGENFVLIAAMSAVQTTISNSDNSFVTKLRHLNLGGYVDIIRKV